MSSFNRQNLPKDLFVANEYVKSTNERKLTLHNPKDGSVVADDVSLAGEEDVESAVVAAEKAFPEWKRATAAQRRELLSKLADLIEAFSDTLSELTRITLGTPVSTFGKREIGYAVQVSSSWLSWFCLALITPIDLSILRWLGGKICRRVFSTRRRLHANCTQRATGCDGRYHSVECTLGFSSVKMGTRLDHRELLHPQTIRKDAIRFFSTRRTN